MEKLVSEFIDLLKEAGIKISISDKMDCYKALQKISVFDSNIFYLTLRCTLIKSHVEYPIFDYIFNEFFREHKRKANRKLSKRGLRKELNLKGLGKPTKKKLGQNQRRGGESDNSDTKPYSEHRRQVEKTVSELAENFTYSHLLTQLVLSPKGVIDLLAQEMAERYVKNEKEQQECSWRKQYTEEEIGSINQSTSSIDIDLIDWNNLNLELSKLLLDLSKHYESQTLLSELSRNAIPNMVYFKERLLFYLETYFAAQSVNDRNNIKYGYSYSTLLNTPLKHLNLEYAAQFKVLIHTLAQKLATRISYRRKKSIYGKLNIKKTLRKSIQYGGVPIDIILQRKRIRKPEIVTLCDISGSVVSSVGFFLLFLSELHNMVSKVRSFVFVSEIDEIAFDNMEKDPNSILKLLKSTNVDHMGYSNFGIAFSNFNDLYSHILTRRTSLIIIGDARNNYRDSRTNLLSLWKSKVNKVIWINPEDKGLWNTGDSIIGQYVEYCDYVFSCSNLNELSSAIGSILE